MFDIKNKKAVFIISEAIIIPLSLMIVGMMIYMASSLSIANEKTFNELTPELTYDYPKVVVYSFLNYPISKNDSLNIFGNDKGYTVSNLIWDSSDESKVLVNFYKLKYLKSKDLDFDSSLELYEKFSENKVSKNILLDIIYNPSSHQTLISDIEYGNFFMKVPTKSGKDTIVYFSTMGH